MVAPIFSSLLAVASAATGAQAEVRVPVAPPSITIVVEGDEPEPWIEPKVAPENEIVLTMSAERRYFSGAPPADVWEAIDVLRQALPPDYMQVLMEDWGYERVDGQRLDTRRGDLREYDLARFLFDSWVDQDSRTQLAAEFDCLSWGEHSIGPFMVLLVDAEASDFEFEGQEHWRLPSEYAQWSRRAVGEARLLLGRCQELTELRSESG